ncbi:MAG: putative zinc transporter msc2 [Chaenotheca gracillima]|nr:MAG: putative zinc transporter msc2 [Chaenotheca gracillima]
MDTSTVVALGTLLGSLIFVAFLTYMRPSRFEARLDRRSEFPVSISKRRPESIQVLVLGDIGRSPRMQYHAISIAKAGGNVELIGYLESEPHPDLLSSPSVTIISLPPPPQFLQTTNKLLFLLFGPLKNPPAIPTLAVAQFVCLLRNTHLLIDWHNFGWSILALKLGERHLLVRIAKKYEFFFGRRATANFTVTDAMARVLKEDHNLRSPILPLHDRPPSQFQPLTPAQRGTFLHQLPLTASKASEIIQGSTRLLVSSTSWTPDEDFSLLLDALVRYSEAASSASLPRILAVITGKGPQKKYYLSRLAELVAAGRLAHVSVLTAWLSNADYAALLGAADLGVSLHMSSSGVDLPMKVVDMFGAGLPVVGWSQFEAWKELVKEGENGIGFASAEELGDSLIELFDRQSRRLQILREGAVREGIRRWDDEWRPVAGRVLGLLDQ